MNAVELDAGKVKSLIPRTWPLFFARHGQFTAVQREAIPPIVAGRDALVIAATASGKTEAVIAPLLERYWQQLRQPGLTILYICPTRALVRDLYERLQPPLADAGIRLSMKTGDTGPISEALTGVLLTTPESTDSLLTRSPRLFTALQAIVLDEIHLLDNSPRGDHTRCLLARLERIRQYANPETPPAQRVALSATVFDPAGIARRYLQSGVVLNIPSQRDILAQIHPLYDLDELVNALAQRAVGKPQRTSATSPWGSRKSLLFCNSRDEVEQTAVYLRQHLPHHAEVFVHYSNLDAQMRREVEERFAAAAVAVCVATSTLELGIDIGSVDDVALLGAPPDLTAFLQRVGRGGRRAARTQVLCMPRSPGEWARFEALLTLAGGQWQAPGGQWQSGGSLAAPDPLDLPPYAFRPSVLIQQIFSLLKQSPTGSIRLADVRRIAPMEITSAAIEQMVSHLTWSDYLQPGRMGEWRPGEKLQELIDQHEIYSNIGMEAMPAYAIDAFTGKTIGQTERVYKKGTILLLGGKPMQVVWQDQNRFGLAPTASHVPPDDILRFQKSYAAIPYFITQVVANLLGIPPHHLVTVAATEGVWLFHFWGAIWGTLLTDMLLLHGLSAEYVNEYAIFLRRPLTGLPAWDEQVAQQAARSAAAGFTNRLELGRFHTLLPAAVAQSTVIQLLHLPRLAQVYQAARLTTMPALEEQLHLLL